MINKHFFEIVLVLLASSTLFSLGLKLALIQQRVNRESLKLWNKLQKSSIQQCLAQRTNFLLPQQSMNHHWYQRGQALAILHEMLLQIFNLFRADISLDGWEKSHMENFLTELHQQLEYLEMLKGLEAEQKSGILSGENPRLQVKMYFWRIHDYLENQEYSRCAWTIVRVEINRCLFFAFQLIRKLRKQEMDSLKNVEQEPTAGFKSIG
ncbi:PREDICTED: interferon epsilon [Odobenus rosmarus divergens]|uniref:Interferon epsilon n=1 Tax=Odobenus rosmarus divergens TaxID=9708 RepID=A0A2U3WUI2_ODORO|nr:PREDICTED: interferon epsilon [Odobenus rosmarus divergens]